MQIQIVNDSVSLITDLIPLMELEDIDNIITSFDSDTQDAIKTLILPNPDGKVLYLSGVFIDYWTYHFKLSSSQFNQFNNVCSSLINESTMDKVSTKIYRDESSVSGIVVHHRFIDDVSVVLVEEFLDQDSSYEVIIDGSKR